MVLRVILCVALVSYNLLTGAESPVSEKLERSSNVEYNKTLKYKTTFLRKPPYILITSHSPLETYDESGFRIRRSALEPKNNVFSNVEILYPSKFFGLEFIESENVITSVNNVYLNGVRIAALNEAGALAYYLTDQVDSVSTVLDDEGNTLSQMQYLPYGETFVQRGDLNFSPKYNSQELDRESGFYFFNARYYDPGIARFTSADTIIDGEFDTQGWNRFSYVKGNPITFKDPTGHVAPLVVFGIAAGIGVTVQYGAEVYDKYSKDSSVTENAIRPLKDTGSLGRMALGGATSVGGAGLAAKGVAYTGVAALSNPVVQKTATGVVVGASNAIVNASGKVLENSLTQGKKLMDGVKKEGMQSFIFGGLSGSLAKVPFGKMPASQAKNYLLKTTDKFTDMAKKSVEKASIRANTVTDSFNAILQKITDNYSSSKSK
ncbi:RHS repeat-associated core domain-containing protein (plasmid) [Leptospira noguchii]|uniref:RHS repeat-associated core domain-containing protein n=1 Tax=Leptospira noguchii TaxID=28182 RepID=UPI001FB6AAB9|nr:RHS repeat-associated core domain-containing protein [Leptospira noguchii]UOG40056.1 RHS repeat-associated core domain-containing protein [Leptospira noguchii]